MARQRTPANERRSGTQMSRSRTYSSARIKSLTPIKTRDGRPADTFPSNRGRTAFRSGLPHQSYRGGKGNQLESHLITPSSHLRAMRRFRPNLFDLWRPPIWNSRVQPKKPAGSLSNTAAPVSRPSSPSVNQPLAPRERPVAPAIRPRSRSSIRDPARYPPCQNCRFRRPKCSLPGRQSAHFRICCPRTCRFHRWGHQSCRWWGPAIGPNRRSTRARA